MHKGIVDGRVTMWVVFTHGITDYTGRLSMLLVRSEPKLIHCIEDSTLNRLKSVSYIRQGS